MKAPVYAYATDGDSFVKLPVREGSTQYNVFVARFLNGAQSAGGYSATAEQMRQSVKTLFKLDELLDVGEEQDDGTTKVRGFVGAVRQGGMNAQHHNLTKRQSGMVLGDGGEASDSFLEAYYKYVKNGTGSYTKAPDGLWVCETMKTAYNGAIRVDMYYGIQIQSGRIRGVFRARTPQMPDTRPTMTLNINVSKVSGYTNRYRVTISLSATANNGAASVVINSLNVRKTQTGAALAGSFTSNGVSPITYPVTVTYSASGMSVMWSCILVTTTAEPFWVTATLQSTALTNYRLVNNGGQSGSGSGTVTPGGPEEIIPIG